MSLSSDEDDFDFVANDQEAKKDESTGVAVDVQPATLPVKFPTRLKKCAREGISRLTSALGSALLTYILARLSIFWYTMYLLTLALPAAILCMGFDAVLDYPSLVSDAIMKRAQQRGQENKTSVGGVIVKEEIAVIFLFVFIMDIVHILLSIHIAFVILTPSLIGLPFVIYRWGFDSSVDKVASSMAQFMVALKGAWADFQSLMDQ